MRDYGYEAQVAAEKHLDACYDAEAEGLEVPSVGPWDGCMACVVREVLIVAWPYAESAVLESLKQAIIEDAAKPEAVRATELNDAVLAELERQGRLS